MPRLMSWTKPRATHRGLVAAAVLAAATGLAAPAASTPGHPTAAPPGPAAPSTLCVPAGTLRGEDGQRASVSLCATDGTPTLSVSAPAACEHPGGEGPFTCLTAGTWTARRDGRPVASGPLPGGRDYPGPGTYDISAFVRVRSAPAGVDLRGEVHATLTLTAPKPDPTHRVEVDGGALRRDSVTTLTYTVARDSERGDDSARFGLIGEEGVGMELTTSDARCGNPLPGRFPSAERTPHVVDCALTGLQPGRSTTVTVRVSVKDTCGTIVSKLGYWIPQGQNLYTGGMLAGPTVGCA
ncbi:hypothetical protein [Streptomyces adelaidensis]|uniref:hypothetical protein n=1 Tax=Streptomyces adelaidensis TaxID=2796465 RepID=UPI001F1A891A|nr:hypothetical protein [Streptomyces adelaidensis]